jgi:hypothetical protein
MDTIQWLVLLGCELTQAVMLYLLLKKEWTAEIVEMSSTDAGGSVKEQDPDDDDEVDTQVKCKRIGFL